MSDNTTQVLLALIAALVPVFGTLLTLLLNSILTKQKELKIAGDKAAADAAKAQVQAAAGLVQAKQVAGLAADKVAQVKQSLEDNNTAVDAKLDGLASVAKATHTLVNSKMGSTLDALAVALAAVAQLSGKSEDQDRADEAAQNYTDHQAKQAIVDHSADQAAKSSTIQPSPPVS